MSLLHDSVSPDRRFCGLFLLFLLIIPREAYADERPRAVLLVLPEELTIPAMTVLAASYRRTVEFGSHVPVTFSIEHLDFGWFGSPDYEAQAKAFYRAKYRTFHPDVLLAVRSDVLEFLLTLRRDLWPDVPIVVLANDANAAAQLPANINITGLWMHYDVAATIENALRMLPETKHVAFVLGSTPWELQSVRPTIDAALRPLAGNVETIDLSGLSFAEIEQKVRVLPDDSILFFHSLLMDSTGRRFVPVQALDALQPSIHCPTFGVHGTILEHGAVGGVLVDYDRLGQDLARVTFRILNGEPASSIPFRAADASFTAFDDRQLKRFRIPDERLPPGSEIRFREPTLWVRYRAEVIAIGSGGLVQALLIAGLLVERRKRARMQSELANGLRFEQLLADISASFANLPANRIDAQIETVLGRVGEFVGVERCTLWHMAARGHELLPSFSWKARGIADQEGPISVSVFATNIQALKQGQPIVIKNMRAFINDSTAERTHFETLGVRSVVVVPITPTTPSAFVLTLATVTREHAFAADIAHRLRAFGELISAVLQRKEVESTLARMHRVSALGELAPSLAHELNQPLSVILTTAQTLKMMLQREEMSTAQIQEALGEIVAADKRASEIIRRMRAFMKKGEPFVESADVNEIARGAVKLLHSEALRRGVTLSVALAPEPLRVQADAVQMEQIVLNLLTNAMDAVESKPGEDRRVVITTKVVDNLVNVCVEDAGHGVAESDLERIFEPFFTTKEKGLGMGLSICRSIAEAHGGRLWAERVPSGGTRFHFVVAGEKDLLQ